MYISSLAEWKRMLVKEQKEKMPTILTVDGEPTFVVGTCGNVICLDDLHPRVQAQLRAQEKRARIGMPQPAKVALADAPTE